MKLNAVLDKSFSAESQTEPITLDEAKNWLKLSLDLDEENTVVSRLLSSAREQCESYLNISLIERTVTAYLQNEQGNIMLPYQPLVPFDPDADPIVDFIYIKDKDQEVISSDNYTLSGLTFKRLCTPSNCHAYVSYNAGYSKDTIPNEFKTAILNQLAWLYENRGDVPDRMGSNNVLSPETLFKLKPHRKVV